MSVLCCVLLAVVAFAPGLAQIQNPGVLPGEVIPQKLGDPCSGLQQCNTIHNAICADRYCTCSKDFVQAMNKTVCLRVVTQLDKSCEQQDQCYLGGNGGGTCKDRKCVCQDDFHFDERDGCIFTRVLEGTCNNNNECYLSQDKEQHIECKNGRCACTMNFKPSEDKQHCNTGAEMTPIFWMSTVMVFLLAHVVA